MLADLCVYPLGSGEHTSPVLAAVLKVVKESGLSYQLTPTSTCIEGTFAQICDVVGRCRSVLAIECPHYVIALRLEEDAGETGKLLQNVVSVEEKAGETLATSPVEGVLNPTRGAAVDVRADLA